MSLIRVSGQPVSSFVNRGRDRQCISSCRDPNRRGLRSFVSILVLVCLTAGMSSRADAILCVGSAITTTILGYAENSGALTQGCGSGGNLPDPLGMTFGPDGNLYAGYAAGFPQSGAVLRYSGSSGELKDTFVPFGSGGLVSTFGLGLGSDSHGTFGMAFGQDNNLYVSFITNTPQLLGAVNRYSGTTGAFLNTFVPAGSGALVSPTGLAFGADGNMYLSFTTNTPQFLGAVNRYSGTTGAFLNTFVPGGSGALTSPSGLIFGPDGNLYISFTTNTLPLLGAVNRYSGTTGAFIDTFVSVGSGGLVSPTDLTFGPDGNLYISLTTNTFPLLGAVNRYSGTTGEFIDNFVPAGLGGLSQPRDLEFAPTPEPATLLLWGTTMAGLGLGARWRRYRQTIK